MYTFPSPWQRLFERERFATIYKQEKALHECMDEKVINQLLWTHILNDKNAKEWEEVCES